jgi:membrane-associated protease RseP (regulator of RpoE activity)
MAHMAIIDRNWRSAVALMTLGAIVALGLFLALRPLRVETPASGSAQALLRLDTVLGATVEPVDRATAGLLGLRSNDGDLVVTSVASRGPAATAGLRVGDVIEQIGGQPAASGDEVLDATKLSAAEPLSIRRGGKAEVLKLQFGAQARG